MEDFVLDITWGQRVSICNLFRTVGALPEMHTSRIMRTILIEGVSAQDLAVNGIDRGIYGNYTIPQKNENRPSSVTLNEEALRAFAGFISDLSDKEQVHIVHESVFTSVMNKYKELTENEGEGEGEEEGEQGEGGE